MKKRGAVELSITTIVVVVIGITLLVLGLVFVKGIFGKLDTITEDVFDKGSTIIDTLSIDTKFSVPSTVTVQQGKTKTFKITVGHDGTITGSQGFDLILTPKFPSGLTETQVRAQIISEHPVILNEGEQATFVIQVATTSNAPLSGGLGRTPAYSVTAKIGTQTYATGAFTIEIEKGKGIF